MIDDYFIRNATGEDAPTILKCLATAFEPYRTRYTPGAWLDTVLNAETIQERLAWMQVLVAVSAEGVVGTIACASVTEDEGHLRGMAVLPAWQGQGVAEALLLAAEAELLRRGCARITLDTTEPLERAMRFYEKHGYRRSGKVIDFFAMPLHEFVKQLSMRDDG
ncbi:MAG TPA: GNAT family N-acetyltransferase [Terriglobales bacterium]|nr:GNAT family N-acetyltransferase [Terriglobales bacterium]